MRSTRSAGLGLLLCISACTQPLESPEVTPLRAGTPAGPLAPAALSTFGRAASSQGALLYVPVYSSVFDQTRRGELRLTSTLSVHNLRLEDTVWITAVIYVDTSGRPLRELVSTPIELGPLATRHFVVPAHDGSGGAGANFLVKWEADLVGSAPRVEALMISTVGQQGISFLTEGSLVKTLTRTATAAP